MPVCVCMCVCVRARMRTCVCVYVFSCVLHYLNGCGSACVRYLCVCMEEGGEGRGEG